MEKNIPVHHHSPKLVIEVIVHTVQLIL